MRNFSRRFYFCFAVAVGLAVGISAAAHAEDTSAREQRLDRKGDRIEEKGKRVDERLDRRGARIDERLDRRGERVGGAHTPAQSPDRSA